MARDWRMILGRSQLLAGLGSTVVKLFNEANRQLVQGELE